MIVIASGERIASIGRERDRIDFFTVSKELHAAAAD
ncbi:Uncharacterised protein [Vibrio cholerae]|nr:Uncharacterised protein [Vibrio cholerae]